MAEFMIRMAFAGANGIRMTGEKRGFKPTRGCGHDVLEWIVADVKGFGRRNAAAGEAVT